MTGAMPLSCTYALILCTAENLHFFPFLGTSAGIFQSGHSYVFLHCSECAVCRLKAVRNELWVLYLDNCRLDINTKKSWPQYL
jgi:hypothetical protein